MRRKLTDTDTNRAQISIRIFKWVLRLVREPEAEPHVDVPPERTIFEARIGEWVLRYRREMRRKLTDTERWRRAAVRSERTVFGIRIGLWVILLIGAALFILPLYIMVAMSLKDSSQIANTSMWEWPTRPTLENFRTVLTNPNASFVLFFKNSTVVTVISTFGVLLSSSLVAYPFARMRFRGRDRLFILLLSTMMLPGIVTMIPTYLIYKELRWVDTFLPLTVPAFFGGGAFNIFLQFFMGIPRDLDEAALLDGASHATIFWRIILPNSGAALATVGIFSFIYSWRDFMGPLLYLNSPENQTLEVGLRTYQTLQAEKWDLLMAGSVLVVIPLLVLFIVGQRYFSKGIVMTGMK
jgi:multiple sugar transport system permease protein